MRSWGSRSGCVVPSSCGVALRVVGLTVVVLLGLASSVARGAPASAPASAAAGASLAPPSATRGDEPELVDPDPTRMVLGPTALTRSRGQYQWTITDLGLHRIDYGVTDRIQVGGEALLPAVYVGFIPQLKASLRLGEELFGALHLEGGIFWPYVEPETLTNLFSGRFALYGGGIVLTKRWGRVLLNAALAAYGVRYGQKEFRTVVEPNKPAQVLSRIYFLDYWALLPSAGLGWHVSRRVKLNLELHLPLGDFDDLGQVWLVMYGVRVFGRETFLDLSFVIPAYPGLGEIIKYIPLGIPLLSVGLQW